MSKGNKIKRITK